MKPYVGNHLAAYMRIQFLNIVRTLHRQVCPECRVCQMHIKRLVADGQPVGITVDDITSNNRPRINQSLLQ